MKTIIFLALSFILVTNTFSQTVINFDGKKIIYSTPDSSSWKLIKEVDPSDGSKGARMFKHRMMVDSKGRFIEPIIGLVFEKVLDSIDVIEYSVGVLGHKPYTIERELLGGYPDHSSDKHSVVFRGDYSNRGVHHKVLLGYIFHNNIGIEIIADATKDVFRRVESEMKAFIKSVNIKE
jgi:hypothetical protein